MAGVPFTTGWLSTVFGKSLPEGNCEMRPQVARVYQELWKENTPFFRWNVTIYPLVIEHSYGKSPFSVGKSTIFVALLHSYFDIARGDSITCESSSRFRQNDQPLLWEAKQKHHDFATALRIIQRRISLMRSALHFKKLDHTGSRNRSKNKWCLVDPCVFSFSQDVIPIFPFLFNPLLTRTP